MYQVRISTSVDRRLVECAPFACQSVMPNASFAYFQEHPCMCVRARPIWSASNYTVAEFAFLPDINGSFDLHALSIGSYA